MEQRINELEQLLDAALVRIQVLENAPPPQAAGAPAGAPAGAAAGAAAAAAAGDQARVRAVSLQTLSNALSLFFADPNDAHLKVNSFIQVSEGAANQYGIALNELPTLCRAKFRSHASEFLAQSDKLQTTNNWVEFKELLLARFSRKMPASSVMMELSAIMQTPREKVIDYANRIKTIGKALYEIGENQGPHNQAIDKLILSSFIRGIDRRIRNVIRIKEPNNLEEAIDIARKTEIDLELDTPRFNSNRSHTVNTLVGNRYDSFEDNEPDYIDEDDENEYDKPICAAMFKKNSTPKPSSNRMITRSMSQRPSQGNFESFNSRNNQGQNSNSNFSPKPFFSNTETKKSTSNVFSQGFDAKKGSYGTGKPRQEQRGSGPRNVTCYNCHCLGHIMRDGICCYYCKQYGHVIENCRARLQKNKRTSDDQFRAQQKGFTASQSGNFRGPLTQKSS